MTDLVESDAAVRVAARDWLLHLELEQPSADDWLRFQAWRQADPRHDAAYRRFETIWRLVASMKKPKRTCPTVQPAARGKDHQ